MHEAIPPTIRAFMMACVLKPEFLSLQRGEWRQVSDTISFGSEIELFCHFMPSRLVMIGQGSGGGGGVIVYTYLKLLLWCKYFK